MGLFISAVLLFPSSSCLTLYRLEFLAFVFHNNGFTGAQRHQYLVPQLGGQHFIIKQATAAVLCSVCGFGCWFVFTEPFISLKKLSSSSLLRVYT